MTLKQDVKNYKIFSAAMHNKWDIQEHGNWYSDTDIQNALVEVVQNSVDTTKAPPKKLQQIFEMHMVGKFHMDKGGRGYGEPSGNIFPTDIQAALKKVVAFASENNFHVISGASAQSKT